MGRGAGRSRPPPPGCAARALASGPPCRAQRCSARRSLALARACLAPPPCGGILAEGDVRASPAHGERAHRCRRTPSRPCAARPAPHPRPNWCRAAPRPRRTDAPPSPRPARAQQVGSAYKRRWFELRDMKLNYYSSAKTTKKCAAHAGHAAAARPCALLCRPRLCTLESLEIGHSSHRHPPHPRSDLSNSEKQGSSLLGQRKIAPPAGLEGRRADVGLNQVPI